MRSNTVIDGIRRGLTAAMGAGAAALAGWFGVGLGVGFCMGVPTHAWAHARLLSTAPPAGATLKTPPKALRLDFNEEVHLAHLAVSTAGKAIEAHYDRDASTSHVVIELPPLAAGTYEIRWSALTVDDGHVVKGSFSFVIAP